MEIITDSLKAIIAVIASIFLALWAKRYSDMKKRDIENKRQEVERVKAGIILKNDSTDIDELIERENNSFNSRNKT